jgi:hypothetical protein
MEISATVATTASNTASGVDQLETHKKQIYQLYMKENKTFQQVIDCIRDEHNLDLK